MLVTKAKQGDKDALVQLIMAQDEQYYQLSYVYMKNRYDALDAIQDMIVAVHENLYRLKNEESFYTWSSGIKYFVNNHFAYTKAKVLIKESYDRKYQTGEIVTVVKTGGIITHYEQIIKDEIDKKFNIPQAELEEAKKKLVVADNYDGILLFPSDQILIFLGERPGFEQAGVERYLISGPVIKFNGDEIRNKEEKTWDGPYVWEEFYSDSLSGLEGRIRKVLEAKQNFSKEKARQAAYQALTDSQRQEVLDWETAVVLYHEKGLGVKTPEGTITVMFRTSKAA